jgi:hypothetical protein
MLMFLNLRFAKTWVILALLASSVVSSTTGFALIDTTTSLREYAETQYLPRRIAKIASEFSSCPNYVAAAGLIKELLLRRLSQGAQSRYKPLRVLARLFGPGNDSSLAWHQLERKWVDFLNYRHRYNFHGLHGPSRPSSTIGGLDDRSYESLRALLEEIDQGLDKIVARAPDWVPETLEILKWVENVKLGNTLGDVGVIPLERDVASLGFYVPVSTAAGPIKIWTDPPRIGRLLGELERLEDDSLKWSSPGILPIGRTGSSSNQEPAALTKNGLEYIAALMGYELVSVKETTKTLMIPFFAYETHATVNSFRMVPVKSSIVLTPGRTEPVLGESDAIYYNTYTLSIVESVVLKPLTPQ